MNGGTDVATTSTTAIEVGIPTTSTTAAIGAECGENGGGGDLTTSSDIVGNNSDSTYHDSDAVVAAVDMGTVIVVASHEKEESAAPTNETPPSVEGHPNSSSPAAASHQVNEPCGCLDHGVAAARLPPVSICSHHHIEESEEVEIGIEKEGGQYLEPTAAAAGLSVPSWVLVSSQAAEGTFEFVGRMVRQPAIIQVWEQR
jgi:hypothetical protein